MMSSHALILFHPNNVYEVSIISSCSLTFLWKEEGKGQKSPRPLVDLVPHVLLRYRCMILNILEKLIEMMCFTAVF